MSQFQMMDASIEAPTKSLLNKEKAVFGRVPNMMTTMAISPVVVKSTWN